MTRIGSAAVVVGAGIAGLTAARTLADRFDRVVVLDRDRLPDDPVPRRGVPQGEHGHVLLLAGQRALEELFPGLLDELTAAGAARFDMGMDLSIYRFGAVWSRIPTAQWLVTPSRALLETTVRQRVRKLPGVEVCEDTSVSGLVGAAGRVIGVRLADGGAIGADLVVDCTGRGGRSNRWLAELGFPAPRVAEITVNLGYATRLYRRTPGDLPDAQAVLVLPDPPRETRTGGVLPIEGDLWMVTLGGWHDGFPRDLESFERHGRESPHPGLVRLLQRAEPVSDVVVYQFPASRRRHFEELRERPVGYLALGDAICSFNPIYGQGMTCASMEAVALGELLDRHGRITDALSADYYRRAAALLATPWQFAAGADFAYPQTKGGRPRGVPPLNTDSRRVQRASIVDPQVREVFMSVQHLVLDPAVLRRPSMVLKVLRAARRSPG